MNPNVIAFLVIGGSFVLGCLTATAIHRVANSKKKEE